MSHLVLRRCPMLNDFLIYKVIVPDTRRSKNIKNSACTCVMLELCCPQTTAEDSSLVGVFGSDRLGKHRRTRLRKTVIQCCPASPTGAEMPAIIGQLNCIMGRSKLLVTIFSRSGCRMCSRYFSGSMCWNTAVHSTAGIQLLPSQKIYLNITKR